jgi:hypothetical protein
MNDKIKQIKKMAEESEGEEDIDVNIKRFTDAAKLIKEVLSEIETKSGKVYEVVSEMDKITEKENADLN